MHRWLRARVNLEAAVAVFKNLEKCHFEDSDGATGLIKGNAKSSKNSSFWQQSRELVMCYPGRVALGSFLDFSEAAGYYGLFSFFALFFLPNLPGGPSLVPLLFLNGKSRALVGGIAGPAKPAKIGR